MRTSECGSQARRQAGFWLGGAPHFLEDRVTQG